MSINRNRSKFNEALSSREYRIKQLKQEYDYCYICNKRSGSFYYDCSLMSMRNKGRHGNGRIISTYDYRAYKTWKYNRKTQWK